MLNYKTFSDNAKMPFSARDEDAGYDLFAAESGHIDCYISSGGGPTYKMIPTDIGIQIPKGHYGQIAPRSGLSAKFGLAILGGVIDNSYSGNIKVIISNQGNERFYYEKGDRIAQLIIIPYVKMPLNKVEEFAKTDRGENGFGSSGNK